MIELQGGDPTKTKIYLGPQIPTRCATSYPRLSLDKEPIFPYYIHYAYIQRGYMHSGYSLTKDWFVPSKGESMTIGDLLFFLTVLIFLGTILFVPFALLKRQVRRARKVSLIALLWMAGYLIALLGASLLTPQTVLPAHQEHCFDDMCFSVVSASTRETLGNSPSQLTTRGSYYLIAVQLRNAGRGRAQKPSSPSFVLVDQQGNSYEVVSKAEEIIGQNPEWDQQLPEGTTATKIYVFDVPQTAKVRGLIISEGGSGFPFVLVLGDENSLFHQKTLMQLPS